MQWSRPVYRKSYIFQDNRHNSRDHCIVSPTFCKTIDTLVKTNVLLVLLYVGLSILQSGAVVSLVLFFVGLPVPIFQSTVIIVIPLSQSDSRYSDQEPRVVSPTFLGLLIRWSSDYRNDRITALTILVDYSNDFSLITNCLALLGTISNGCDLTDIIFVCLSEFEIL